MNSIVCFYHGNCFDGMCAAWVVKKKYPSAKLVPVLYGEPVPTLALYRETILIIVDFSYNKETLLELANRVKFLHVIDHHKTAKEELEELDLFPKGEIIFDMMRSGAGLAWDRFFPDTPRPKMVNYIQDRDLWKFELPDSNHINSYIQSYPMNIDSYEEINSRLEHSSEECKSQGEAIERYKSTMVDTICKTMRIRSIGGYLVPVVNTSILFSEIPHRLCELYPEYPFAAYYYDRSSTHRQWGLRSIGDFDVSAVAKTLGGGGHRNAAGFEEKFSTEGEIV